jgi:hypothetical protein
MAVRRDRQQLIKCVPSSATHPHQPLTLPSTAAVAVAGHHDLGAVNVRVKSYRNGRAGAPRAGSWCSPQEDESEEEKPPNHFCTGVSTL